MNVRNLLIALTAPLIATATPLTHAASSYPERAVKMIVPFPPGGSTDTIARVMAKGLSERLGQPVIVDNRAGAGGSIGLGEAARSAPDGYTIVIGSTNTMAVNPTLFSNLNYDPLTDLAPLIHLADVSNVLVVHPSVPANSVQELIALLKANPGKYNYASPGVGNSSHLASELFKLRAGVDMTHIPYKGDVPAITDLISGEVQIMFATAGVIQPHIQAGRVKALGIGGSRRLPSMPDIPTISEAGLDDFEASAWFGLSTRAGVDPEIIERLNVELNAVLKEPAVVEHFERLNATTVGGSASEYGKFLKIEAEKWGSLVKALNLKVD